jgi:hypothetical protein
VINTSFVNWFYCIRTHIFFLIVCYFFYCRKIFFSCIEMIYCYLIHCDIHYWAMTSLNIMSSLYRVVRRGNNLWCNILPRSHYKTAYSSTLLFLYFFTRLKYWRQQTLILHKWTIMMIFSDCYSSNNAACNIVFYVTIKCLMLTIFYF